MSSLDAPFLLGFLPSIGVDPQEEIVDRILQHQRMLQLRFAHSRQIFVRNAAIVEIACRQFGKTISRDELLLKLGVKISASDYRQHLLMCEAGLGVKRDPECIFTALSLVMSNPSVIDDLRAEANQISAKHLSTLTSSQRRDFDTQSLVFLGSCVVRAGLNLKVPISVDDIIGAIDCPKSVLTKQLEALNKSLVTHQQSDYPQKTGLKPPIPKRQPVKLAINAPWKRSFAQLSACQSPASTQILGVANPFPVEETPSARKLEFEPERSHSTSTILDEQFMGAANSNHKRSAYEVWKLEKLKRARIRDESSL